MSRRSQDLQERGNSLYIVSLLRMLTGAVISVWGKGTSRRIVTPTVTAGIRGTGVYTEVPTYADWILGRSVDPGAAPTPTTDRPPVVPMPTDDSDRGAEQPSAPTDEEWIDDEWIDDEWADEDWADGKLRALSFLIRGEAGEYHLTATGEPQPDDSFFVILNALHEPVEWAIPALEVGKVWERLFDTDTDDGFNGGQFHDDKSAYTVQPRSFVLMVRRERR